MVLVCIFPASDLKAPSLFVEDAPHVMTCSNIIVAKFLAAFLKRTEFYIAIAINARVWGLTGKVRIAESIDNFSIEWAGKVIDEMRDAELKAYLARIFDIARRATCLLIFDEGIIVVEELHRNTFNLVALITQDKSRHGAVDPSAHGHEHSVFVRRRHHKKLNISVER